MKKKTSVEPEPIVMVEERRRVTVEFVYGANKTLEFWCKQFDEWAAEYSYSAFLDIDFECGADNAECWIVFQRPETDKEREKRLKIKAELEEKTERAHTKQRDKDLREYKRLKNLFDNGEL